MQFFDTDRWNEIWQTISRNRKRSVMTALGIFWGIFMLTVLLGAGMGLGRMFRSQLGDISTNTLLLQSNQTSVPYKGMPSGRRWRMENEDAENIKRLPEVLYVSGINWAGEHPWSAGQHKGDYSVMGYAPDYQRINPEKIVFGRYINQIDMERRRRVCVIGTQVWKDLFPGGEDPTGKVIQLHNAYFTVVGVMTRQSQLMTFSDIERTVVLPLTFTQYSFGFGKTFHMLAVAGRGNIPSKELEERCKTTLFSRHIISSDDPKAAWTMSASDFVGKIQSLFTGISLLTWVVGLGTLLAGIVGVSNIMLVLIKERTQEIGIRRALGAPPRAIITQIISESFVLTFIAGVLGLTAGVGILSLVESFFRQQQVVAPNITNISWQISFGMGMASLAILVAGSLLAGVIPAYRALKIKAIDAIREE